MASTEAGNVHQDIYASSEAATMTNATNRSSNPPPALPSRNSSLSSKPPPPPPPVRRTAALTNPNAVTIGTLRSAGVNSIQELRRSMGRAQSELNVNLDPMSSSCIYSNSSSLRTGVGGGSQNTAEMRIQNGGGSSSASGMTRSSVVHPMERSEYQNANELFGQHHHMRVKMGGARSAMEVTYGNLGGNSPAPPTGSHNGSSLEIGSQPAVESTYSGQQQQYENAQQQQYYNQMNNNNQEASQQMPGQWNKLTSIHRQFMQTLNEKLAQNGTTVAAFDPRSSPKIMKRRSMSLPHSDMEDEQAYAAGLAGLADGCDHISANHPLNQSYAAAQITNSSYVGDNENPYANFTVGPMRRDSSESGNGSQMSGSLSTSSGSGRSRERERRNSHSHGSSIQQSLLNLFSGSRIKGVISSGSNNQSSQNNGNSLTSSRTQSPDTTSICTSTTSTTGRRGSALTIASIDRESLVRILNTKLAQKRQNELERANAATVASHAMAMSSTSLNNSPLLARRGSGGNEDQHSSSASDSDTITSSNFGAHVMLNSGNSGHSGDTDTDSGIGHGGHCRGSGGSAANSVISSASSIIASYNANANSVSLIQTTHHSTHQVQPMPTPMLHVKKQGSEEHAEPNVLTGQVDSLQLQKGADQFANDTVTPTNQSNFGSRVNMSIERDNMYKLMISQLFFDGHQDLALQICSRASLRPGSCTPSDRLLQAIANGMRDISDERSSSSNSRGNDSIGSRSSLNVNPPSSNAIRKSQNSISRNGGEPLTQTSSSASYSEQLQSMPILPCNYEPVYSSSSIASGGSGGHYGSTSQIGANSASHYCSSTLPSVNSNAKQLQPARYPPTNPFMQHWNDDDENKTSTGLLKPAESSLTTSRPVRVGLESSVRSLFDLTSGSLAVSPDKEENPKHVTVRKASGAGQDDLTSRTIELINQPN